MPVANEESTMPELLERFLKLPYEDLYLYVIMDDYSKDRTADIVREYEERTGGRIKYVYYADSHGVISCYLEGYRRALADGAERVIEMDGGLSHLPEEIPRFIEKLDEGYDCVFGCRYLPGGGINNHPLHRRLLSYGGTLLSNTVLGTRLNDMTSGFEAFQRPVLENFILENFLSTGHMYQTEMRYYCRDYRNAEVPIHYVGGKSSLKGSSISEALRILFELKKNDARVRKTVTV